MWDGKKKTRPVRTPAAPDVTTFAPLGVLLSSAKCEVNLMLTTNCNTYPNSETMGRNFCCLGVVVNSCPLPAAWSHRISCFLFGWINPLSIKIPRAPGLMGVLLVTFQTQWSKHVHGRFPWIKRPKLCCFVYSHPMHAVVKASEVYQLMSFRFYKLHQNGKLICIAQVVLCDYCILCPVDVFINRKRLQTEAATCFAKPASSGKNS